MLEFFHCVSDGQSLFQFRVQCIYTQKLKRSVYDWINNIVDEDFLQVQVMAINANDFDENTYPTGKAALDAALPIDSTDFNPFN